eukprot:CAMPEP_0119266966 /NCGR_PEP_ID=MMETSP1329-20130426/5277_1 /TAXON_ID=114041 /ORGANISM="Genus nov. species nov., Strain RCC1024" /LENGTH=193 /DNA_ID=CAMNT_0007266871 /DNA_START=188 /DNA_END=766 /DNA_ORIENTATION=-
MANALDGFLHRRTRYGAWKERYFRTEGYQLFYYSENLNSIKANRVTGKGPYRYKKVGSPSEAFDLRGETTIEASETDELVFVVEHGARRVDIKAPDAEEKDRWIAALSSIVRVETEKRKAVGSVSIEVDGAYIVGGDVVSGEVGSERPACRLEFQIRNDVYESAPAQVERKRHLSYENLDEAQDNVGYAPLRL